MGKIRWILGTAFLSTVAVAVACTNNEEQQAPEAPSPIIGGGAATGAQYNAIGSLAQAPFSGFAPRSFCTGTLIGPHTVLTAKHCALSDPLNPSSGTKLDEGPVYFMIGPDARRPLRRVRAASVKASPLFGGGYTSLGSDVAVYTLSEDITDIAPFKVAPTPPTAADEGTAFLVVGYGVQNAAGQSQTRKAGRVTLRSVSGPAAHVAFGSLDSFVQGTQDVAGHPLTDAEKASLPLQYDAPLLLDYEVYTGEAPSDDQVCNGDSGGPLIRVVDGKPLIIGVASTTMTKRGNLCDKGGIHAVFGAHTRRFIAGFINETCELDEHGALACNTGSNAGAPSCAYFEPDGGGDAGLPAYGTCLANHCCAETTACFGDSECRTLRGCLIRCATPSTADGGADAGADPGACARECYRAHAAVIGRYFGFTDCARSCATAPDAGD